MQSAASIWATAVACQLPARRSDGEKGHLVSTNTLLPACGRCGDDCADDQIALLQAALDAMPGHIAILDRTGKIISVNARWIDYARENQFQEPGFGIGLNYLDICRPAAGAQDPDAQKVSEGLHAVLNDPQVRPFVHEYLCPHPGDPARDRWFLLTITPFSLRGERCALMSHEDITERHGLERTRTLLETGIAQSRSGIMITNAEGMIEYVNHGFTAMTGYAADEVIGQNPRLLKSGKIGDETYLELWRTIASGAVWKGHVCNRRKEGPLYWEEMSISPVRDALGVITHFVAVKEDITLQRQQALLHEGVIKASADAFVAMDEQLNVIEWGDQAEAFLGIPRADALGRPLVDLLFALPEDAPTIQQFRQLSAGQGTSLLGRPQRLRVRHRRGDPVPVELSLVRLSLEGEQYYCGFLRDLEDTIRRESLLLEAQKMEGVGQMACGLAHDFNNILSIVISSLHLALEQQTGGSEALIANALSAATHGVELTRSLSAFSRRGQMQIVAANVNELLSALSPLIQQTVGKRVALQMLLQPGLPEVAIDVNAFNNTMINLVINARDAMTSRGRLIIRTLARTLPDPDYPGLELPAGDYVILSVKDNGVGMPEDILDKVFEPFFTTKPEGKGTGLGLPMVNGFCRQSGGCARITSQLGRGTTVQLILPANGSRHC